MMPLGHMFGEFGGSSPSIGKGRLLNVLLADNSNGQGQLHKAAILRGGLDGPRGSIYRRLPLIAPMDINTALDADRNGRKSRVHY